MGVLIAYPNKYKLETIKIINIGDSIKDKMTSIDQSLEKDDIWSKAIRKRNTLLCLKLNYNGNIFCIGTYHVPCTDESIKLIHIISCVQLINKFSGNYKYILSGDFRNLVKFWIF